MRTFFQDPVRVCDSVDRQSGGRNVSAASVSNMRRIGWIGLGKMGLPICERLAAHRFEVVTLTRNPEGRERARANLQSESKIGGVVASADIVVSAISDDAALLHIVFGLVDSRTRCTRRRYSWRSARSLRMPRAELPKRCPRLGWGTFDPPCQVQRRSLQKEP